MADRAWLEDHIRDVPDFPKPGIVFKDLTPLLADGEAFRFTVDSLAGHFSGHGVDVTRSRRVSPLALSREKARASAGALTPSMAMV